MKILKLPGENLNGFIETLRGFGQLLAPQRKGSNSFVFAPLKDISKIDLNYTRTILPLKKYLLRPVETISKWTPCQGYRTTPENEGEKHVLFGVHPCDIKAIEILDMVMRDNYIDERYFAARDNIAVIGISCEPDELCFCHSMQADFVESGFELFLSDVDDGYLVTVRTSLGDDMVSAAHHLFEEVTRGTIERFKYRNEERRKRFSKQSQIDISQLPEIIDLEYKSVIWKEYGDKCLSCGGCTMVCPTCYCYDIYDEVALSQQEGVRKRKWDSCFFADYALVAGGENFREKRHSRFRYRYLHKQEGFVSKYGRPSCTGCGRCIEVCPAGIDLREVIRKIRGGA